jgi:hypothetical protein
MPHEFGQYRLQLIIEYNRVLAWGKAVGLLDVAQGSNIATTLGTDTIELVAILARIQWLLSEFRDLNARYGNEVRPLPSPLDRTRGKEPKDAKEPQLSDIDVVKGISSLAISYEETKEERRHLRGTNHIRDFFGRVGRHAKDIVTHPSRVRWIVIDKEAFQALLSDLHPLTERLHELTRSHQARRLDEITAKMYREMLLTRNDIGDLKAMFGAVSNLMSTSSGTPKDPTTDYNHYQALQELTRLKKLSRISDNILSQLLVQGKLSIGDCLSRLNLSVRQYTDADLLDEFEWNEGDADYPEYLPRPRGLLLQGKRHKKNGASSQDGTQEDWIPVWIEWKVLADAPAGSAREREAVLRTAALAEMLAHPKPAALRAPECVGFFDDRSVSGADRLAWIFRMPPGSDANTRICVLRDLLGQPRWRPSLSQRIAMASALCDTILHLHAINWLHKGVFSPNVLFHMNPSSNDEVMWEPEKPVLCGFEYSRPDGTKTTARETDMAWDIYRWPGIQRERPTERNSKKTYDLYSLGLLLLEIAFWQKLDELMCLGRHQPLVGNTVHAEHLPLEQSRNVRDWLLGVKANAPFQAKGLPNPLDQLRDLVGDRYWRAVRRCLWAHGEKGFGVEEMADQSNDSDVGLALQEAFTKHVVEEIRSIHV